MEQGITIQEAAAILNVHEKTIRRRIKDGTLIARKIKRAQGYEWRVYLNPDQVDSPEIEVSGAEYTDTSTALALAPIQVSPPPATDLLRIIQEQAETIGYLKALLWSEQEQRLLAVQVSSDEHSRPWWRRLLRL